MLLANCAVLLGYVHFGIPAAVARYTGLGHVSGVRGLLGLTLAESLLVVRWRRRPARAEKKLNLERSR